MSISNTRPLERRPIHPGEMLREEFLPEYGLSVTALVESRAGAQAGDRPHSADCGGLTAGFWTTRAAAHAAIAEYIEGWYNMHRRHSALGYVSPAAYEAVTVFAHSNHLYKTRHQARAPGHFRAYLRC